MALLERVATLIKANLNDLIDKAEDPEKLVKQLLLDMQNQFLQVKTQVAIAIADQHLLERKHRDNTQAQQEWRRKAELALRGNDEELTRLALERSLTHQAAAENFAQQVEDQTNQVRLLRDTLRRLELKIAETRTQAEVLMAQHRRARTSARTAAASAPANADAALDRMKWKVAAAEAAGHGQLAAAEPNTAERFAALDRAEQVDRLLAELKMKALPAAGG